MGIQKGQYKNTSRPEWGRNTSPGNQIQVGRLFLRDKYRFRIPRMRLSRMPPMFSRGQRRDETPYDATIHERTLRPNHEKEILHRKSRNEIRVYVGTRI